MSRHKKYTVSYKVLLHSVPLLFIFVLLNSCRTVKPWQRAYLNDEAMQMNKRTAEKFSSGAHTNREAATGGGSGKASGGCGCN